MRKGVAVGGDGAGGRAGRGDASERVRGARTRGGWGDDDRCGRCCVPIRRSIIPFANSLSGYVCIDIARVLGAGGVGDLLAGS